MHLHLRRVDSKHAIGEPAYPPRLYALEDPPAVLFVRGKLPHLSPSVGIVGSRRATEDARRFTEQLAFEVTRAGVTVISGGALGIDGAAHEGAIRAEGQTIVVLPTSLSRPSPRAHYRLFRRVLEQGGAWIAEHERAAHRSDFRMRNRLIAALSDLIVVVQAAKKSGTCHTIEAARRLGRTVAAVPWPPNDPLGATCLDVLRMRGPPIGGAGDVLRLLGMRVPRGRTRPAIGGSPERVRVLSALLTGGQTLDVLQQSTGIAASALLALVTELEIEGAVVAEASGRIALAAGAL
jgi:DNA processing protein